MFLREQWSLSYVENEMYIKKLTQARKNEAKAQILKVFCVSESRIYSILLE